MKLQIELISQKTVKPSSPTPHHLRRHNLSSLDQVMIKVFMPWLFFYPNDAKANNKEKTDRIEKSLSEALTVFYPLAGRVKDNTHVECNDEGIHFMVAKANCPISDVLDNPDRCDINKLLPFELDDPLECLAFVQVTHFGCGGMAIGLGFSHKLGDALSSITFINTWAALARGESNITAPRFDLATYFPPIDISTFDPGFEVVTDKIATRMFVFSASSIATLRDKYTNKNGTGQYSRRPTRVEALTLFIWSRFMAATQVDAEANDKIYTVCCCVNLRPRMDPPLSEYNFGNIFVEPVAVVPKVDDVEDRCFAVLSQMRDAINGIDSNYVKTIQEGDKYLNIISKRAEGILSGQVISLNFTSCCRFPVYEVDFGWGKPAWVGSVRWPYNNLVAFVDTTKGDGIEVWIHLSEQDMAKFEVDKELAAFTSPPQDFNFSAFLANSGN